MIKRINVLIILTIAFCFLSSCNVAESMNKTKLKTSKVADAIEKELGIRPQIGFRIHNGSLKRINISFNNNIDKKSSIEDIERIIRKSLKENMEEQPENTVLSILL